MKTLVPLGLLVLSVAAAEPHVDWSQEGPVVEDVARKREAEPNEIHVDWSRGGVIVEENKKREAVANEIHVDWAQDGLVVEAEKVKRADGIAAPSASPNSRETETPSHKHGHASKSKAAGATSTGRDQGANQGDGGSSHAGDGSQSEQPTSAGNGSGAITVITDPRSGGGVAAQTITAQSQRATMFIPTLTYCGAGGSAEETVAAVPSAGETSDSAASTSTHSDEFSPDLQQRDTQDQASKKQKKGKKHADKAHKFAAAARPSSASHKHHNTSTPTTGDNSTGSDSGSIGSGCHTIYRSTFTPICHTTLRGDGMGPVTVDDCAQQVTFRREVSQQATVDYIAKWDQIQKNHVPTGTVTIRQCQAGSCTSSVERWQEASTDAPETQTVRVEFNEEVFGPATMNYGNTTITIAAGQTSRVAIHTQVEVAASPAAKMAYVERRPLSNAAEPTDSESAAESTSTATDGSSPSDASSPSDGSSPSSGDGFPEQPEVTTTITRYSSTTITVTDWPSNTGAAGSESAAAAPNTSLPATRDASDSEPTASAAVASGSNPVVGTIAVSTGGAVMPSNGAAPATATSISEISLPGTTDPIETAPPQQSTTVSGALSSITAVPISQWTSGSSDSAPASQSEPLDSWSRSPHPLPSSSSNTEPLDSWSRSPHHSPSNTAAQSMIATDLTTPDFTGLPIGTTVQAESETEE